MAYVNPDDYKNDKRVKSLNSLEAYSIQDDKWETLEPFTHARQMFSVCHFNEKFIFIFGGKCLKNGAELGDKEKFTFVKEVEVFDVDQKVWKVINYIGDVQRLNILSPGTAQITGS